MGNGWRHAAAIFYLAVVLSAFAGALADCATATDRAETPSNTVNTTSVISTTNERSEPHARTDVMPLSRPTPTLECCRTFFMATSNGAG